MGYSRAGFTDIVGVDIKPLQRHSMIAWLVFIVLLLAGPAQAAVSVITSTRVIDASTVTLDGDVTATATFTPTAANQLAVVKINLTQNTACTNPSNTVTAVADDQANTWTLFTENRLANGVDGCAAGEWRGAHYIYWVYNPVQAATTIRVTVDITVFQSRIVAGVDLYSGSTSTPLSGNQFLYQAAGPSTITTTVSSASGSLISSLTCNGTAVPTVANGQDARWDGGADLANNCASTGTGTVAGAASFSDTWNVDAGDSSALTSFNITSTDVAASPPARTLLGVGQ